VGECFFWYRSTRVVPDQRPLNGRCCFHFSNIGATVVLGGSVAEWLACWTQTQKGPGSVATLSGNSLRQTVRTHCASVHQAAKLVAALLRVVRVTAGFAEGNGSLPPGS